MDMSQLLRALGLQQAYQAYQQNIGEPFAAVVGGAGRGYLGLDKPEYGGLLSDEAYKTGQAMGYMPAIGAPAGAFKAAAQASGLLSDAAQFLRNLNPEQMGLLGVAASKGIKGKIDDVIENIDYIEYKNPRALVPPHEVRDTEKLKKLTESMENEGWVGRPVLVYDIGRGPEALTGSHRIAAARNAGLEEIPVVMVDPAIGNYLDKTGRSIVDVSYEESKNIAKYLSKFGDENAALLMKLEDYFDKR
jgi:hypothetical protein